MEEQMREYYEKVRGLFPEMEVQINLACYPWNDGIARWIVSVKGKPTECECCHNRKSSGEYSSVADTFDAALAKVIAQAGV